MQFPNPGLARRASGSSLHNEAAPEVPMSAARLAAETAFSDSRQRPALPPPTITVRRSRGLGADWAGAEAVIAADGTAAPAIASKGPRVFRLVAATPQVADAVAAEPGEAPASSLAPLEAAEVSPSRRKRRVADKHKPGPVVQLFKAAIAPDDHADAASLVAGGVTREQVAALAAMLDSIRPILEDIRRARTFRVADSGSAGRWQSLAATAEKIRQRIDRGFQRE